MDKNISTIEEYFKLSDLASSDKDSLNKIIELFSDKATIKSGMDETSSGKKEVSDFFEEFFDKFLQLKHLFRTEIIDDFYQTEWAVIGLKKDNSLFSLHGYDYYKFNESGQITSLVVNVS